MWKLKKSSPADVARLFAFVTFVALANYMAVVMLAGGPNQDLKRAWAHAFFWLCATALAFLGLVVSLVKALSAKARSKKEASDVDPTISKS